MQTHVTEVIISVTHHGYLVLYVRAVSDDEDEFVSDIEVVRVDPIHDANSGWHAREVHPLVAMACEIARSCDATINVEATLRANATILDDLRSAWVFQPWSLTQDVDLFTTSEAGSKAGSKA